MSNDLLFSIIPRANNRLPVKDRGQIKRIDAVVESEELNEEERALHNEQRRVSEKQQYREHHQRQGEKRQNEASSQDSIEQSETEKAASDDVSGGTNEKSKSPSRRKHIDKYA